MLRSAATRRIVVHTLNALGAGAGAFLSGVATITNDPWAKLGAASGLAVLAALGAAQLYRLNPNGAGKSGGGK